MAPKQAAKKNSSAGKGKAGGKGAKGSGTPTPDEENPVRDLKRFIDGYTRHCEKHGVTPCAAVVRKFKQEIGIWNEADKAQVLPNFPVIVSEPLDYPSVQSLMDALADYRWLHQVSFWKAKIGDDGVMVIAEFLKRDQRLRTLELLNNSISAKGCTFLGRMLTQNDTLTNLMLDHNDLGDDGIAALGEGLKWNSSVAHLSLQYCGIGPSGGEAIAKTIIRSSSVRELFLKGNAIGPTGVIAVAHAVAKSMVLQKLDLSDNAFGIDLEAIEALRDGIESNDSLVWVDLHLNSMVPAGAAMLLEVLRAKPNITEFRIYERVGEQVFKDTVDTVSEHIKALKKGKKKPKKKAKKQ
eukprot:TRINITY_DN68078_c0_g1_i1.p1 TRINITY_DN68078_c0_g1~~TRINITY_DN68078_c0_g1_i1.p1  ORF type:complete len:352 (-),score=104.51 TRINITY_DN68078_c0_g1_i1:46-1101(-)